MKSSMEYCAPSARIIPVRAAKVMCLSGDGNESLSSGYTYGSSDFDQED